MTTASTQSSSSRYEKSRRDPLHTWHGWKIYCWWPNVCLWLPLPLEVLTTSLRILHKKMTTFGLCP